MHADILTQIAVAVVVATLLAFLAKFLRQPIVLAYIAAGLVVGPTEGLGLISAHDIEPISELGLILLLFMIGLEIDLKKLRRSGRPVLVAGSTQFLICVGFGLLFAPFLGLGAGWGRFSTLYFAVAAALSSTTIVVKLLYDKFELDTFAGRITLGILVFQDIWAILFLAVQPNLADPSAGVLLVSLAKGAAAVAFALLVSRYLLPFVFRSIAKLPELMLMGALAWCLGMSTLAAQMGLSREMGALIAGIAISTFPYNLDVIAKIVSLRDFFITLFFVTLGTRIAWPSSEMVWLAVAASAFLIVSRFLSITPVLSLLRSGNRGSFIPALNLAQASEFSLVIAALGVEFGHVTPDFLSLIVLVLVLTSVLSTYGIFYSNHIFTAVNPVLRKLGLRDLQPPLEDEGPAGVKPIVFLGFAHDASSLLHEMLARDPSLAEQVLVIDFNPHVKQELERRHIACVYGDVSHADTLLHAGVQHARVVISTIPDMLLKGTSNLRLVRQLASFNADGITIVTAQDFHKARELYDLGASFVYLPRLMSVRELREVVLAGLHSDLARERQEALEQLEDRAEVLP